MESRFYVTIAKANELNFENEMFSESCLRNIAAKYPDRFVYSENARELRIEVFEPQASDLARAGIPLLEKLGASVTAFNPVVTSGPGRG
jgi:hypothetical protein